MSIRNALARRSSVTLKTRSRSRKPRERKNSTASKRKTWFTTGDATPDYHLRELVQERFMSMSDAHDRIRTKLLATGR